MKDNNSYFWYRPLNRKTIEKIYGILKYDGDVKVSISAKRKLKKFNNYTTKSIV